jgi:NSS family neurotransmitter:Na+ symporter
MVSGLFFALAVIASGVRRFREEQLNHPDSDIRLGAWWDVIIAVIVPLEALILLVWWLVQARGWDPAGWLSPFGIENVGTILLQWGVVLAVLAALNGWMVRRIRGSQHSAIGNQPSAIRDVR